METPIDNIMVTLSTHHLQTYSSHIEIVTHFQGLTYFMYHWYFTTAAFFTSIITMVLSLILTYIYSLIHSIMLDSEDSIQKSQQARDTLALTDEFKETYHDLSVNGSYEEQAVEELDLVDHAAEYVTSGSLVVSGTSFTHPYTFIPDRNAPVVKTFKDALLNVSTNELEVPNATIKDEILNDFTAKIKQFEIETDKEKNSEFAEDDGKKLDAKKGEIEPGLPSSNDHDLEISSSDNYPSKDYVVEPQISEQMADNPAPSNAK